MGVQLNKLAISHKIKEHSLELLDEHGHLISKFNLAGYELPEKLIRELFRAMLSEFGHTALETQRQVFRCIRKFVIFLKETCAQVDLPLRPTTPTEYHQWLANANLVGATAQSHQNVIFALLKWLQRNSPGVISARAGFFSPNFQRTKPNLRKPLSEETVRKVLSACYKEIEEVEARWALGDRLLRGESRDSKEEELASLLCDLLKIGGGHIPGQIALNRAGNNLARRVVALGGLTCLKALIYVSPEAMFPFYLAVMCQTAGNPFPIARIQCDCIEPHPIREDIEVLLWNKPRSRSEQRAEFPRSKQWSAPSIVRKYLRVSKYTREHFVKGRNKAHLFIALPRRGFAIGRVPCAQLMHVLLDDFISRHNIDNFDFKDLRIFSASAHKATSGGIFAAKKKLNHRSLRTTEKYINPIDVAPVYDKFIQKFQGRIISLTRDGANTSPECQLSLEEGKETAASTVFGFDCSDPYSGISGRSRRGELCVDFTGCATCAGAVIPTDDPVVISRLISAKLALGSAQSRSIKEGWAARFNRVYLPTLSILENDILPAVSQSVLAEATLLANARGIPFLE